MSALDEVLMSLLMSLLTSAQSYQSTCMTFLEGAVAIRINKALNGCLEEMFSGFRPNMEYCEKNFDKMMASLYTHSSWSKTEEVQLFSCHEPWKDERCNERPHKRGESHFEKAKTHNSVCHWIPLNNHLLFPARRPNDSPAPPLSGSSQKAQRVWWHAVANLITSVHITRRAVAATWLLALLTEGLTVGSGRPPLSSRPFTTITCDIRFCIKQHRLLYFSFAYFGFFFQHSFGVFNERFHLQSKALRPDWLAWVWLTNPVS